MTVLPIVCYKNSVGFYNGAETKQLNRSTARWFDVAYTRVLI